MPLLRGPALLERIWRWVDRLDPGDAVTREDLDATADDLAQAITDTYRAARRRAIPAADLPPTGEPFEQIVTLQPDDSLHEREWRISGWITRRVMQPSGIVTVLDEGATPAADTTPPPKPLGWTPRLTLDGVVFSGPPSPATDFRAFRLWEAEVAQPSSLATLVDERAALQIARMGMQPGEVKRFWISAVDWSGNDSEKSDYMDAGPAPTISDFAQRIITLEAESNNAQARLFSIETAYVTADEAAATRLDVIEATYVDFGALESEVTTVAAGLISSEAIVRADADDVLAQRLDTIEASYVTQLGLEGTVTAEVTAQISTESTARASADEALATRLDTIEADYQTSGEVSTAINAAITTESTARAAADGALATRLDTIEASYETTAGAQAKVDAKALELTTAYAAADGALSSRIEGVEADYAFIISSIDALDGDFGDLSAAISAAVASEATARANADSALSTRIGAVEASYVTTGAMTTAINAKASEITVAYAAADAALSSRTTALESSVNNSTTGLSATRARVTATEEAIASETSARATALTGLRAELLKADSSTSSVIDDTRFRDWGAVGTPSWSRWTAGGTLAVAPQPGGQALTFTVTATQQDGPLVASSRATWTGPKNAAAFVIEVDATLVSGVLDGAGVYVGWISGAGTFVTALRFSAMQAQGEGRVRYSAVFRRPSTFSGTFTQINLHLMANWGGFLPMAAKSITFHECRIRPATAEELGSGQVGAAITTAVSAETTARTTAIANEAQARTTAINTAKSEILGGSTRTLAQVDASQETKVTQAQADSRADSRISAALGVGGAINGAIAAQVQNEATARANADLALANQVSTLTANYNGTAAQVTTQATAIAGLQAREAAYKIEANAGVPGGIEVVSTANGSRVKLSATEILLEASVIRQIIAGQAVGIDQLEQNALVLTYAAGYGAAGWEQGNDATGGAWPSPVAMLDIWVNAGPRGGWITAHVNIQGASRSFNYNYVQRIFGFRVEAYWPGGGSSIQDRSYVDKANVDEFGFSFSSGVNTSIPLTGIEARPGVNQLRLWSMYRDLPILGAQLWLTLVRN